MLLPPGLTISRDRRSSTDARVAHPCEASPVAPSPLPDRLPAVGLASARWQRHVKAARRPGGGVPPHAAWGARSISRMIDVITFGAGIVVIVGGLLVVGHTFDE